MDVLELNPYHPRPYTFSEAALCLRDSIRAAGHASELHVNAAPAGSRLLVVGALPTQHALLAGRRPRNTVIFNFEQLGSSSGLIGNAYGPWLRQWPVADYHQANVDWLRAGHDLQWPAQELPVVPSQALAFRPDLPNEPAADVLFYGSMNPRRAALLDELRRAGLAVEVVAGAFGPELSPAIKRARVVLHVHFYEQALFPVARILQPVMQGVPVVCESSVLSPLNDWSASGIVFAPYEGLADACKALVADAREREVRAERNRAFAATLDFATPFSRLLRQLEARPPAPIVPPRPLPPPTAQPVAGSQPPAPPRAEGRLSDEEIEAILAAESAELPPEAHVQPPPLSLAERPPEDSSIGKWLVVLVALFGLYTLWRSLPQ